MKFTTQICVLVCSVTSLAASKGAKGQGRKPAASSFDSMAVTPLSQDEKNAAIEVASDIARFSETIENVERWKRRSPLDLGLNDSDEDIKLQKALVPCDYESKNVSKASLPGHPDLQSLARFTALGDCDLNLKAGVYYNEIGSKHLPAKYGAVISGSFENKGSLADITQLTAGNLSGEASSDILGDSSSGTFRAQGTFQSKKYGEIPYDIFSDAAVKKGKTEKDITGTAKHRLRFAISGKLYQFENTGELHWGGPRNVEYVENGKKITREAYLSYLGVTAVHARGKRMIDNGFPIFDVWAAKTDCALRVALDPWITTDKAWKGLQSWRDPACGILK